jgi:putative DNA primase/helicase
MQAKNVRYCKQTGQCYLRDGLRWAADQTESTMQLARQVAEHIDVEADYVRDANFSERVRKKEEIIRWAKTSENEHRLRAKISLAESFPEVAITSDRFDSDRMLLTCLNGTLDLELFDLRPHRREDFITKLAPVNYIEGATLTYWDSFLEKDADVRKYVQRVMGYSLTSKTDEEKLFYICGPTASGKSTFMKRLRQPWEIMPIQRTSGQKYLSQRIGNLFHQHALHAISQ